MNLEAAAMELPVVTTNAIGAEETIVDGKTGIVVPVRSVEPLVAALEKLLSDPNLRIAMGKAGRKHIQDNFEQKAFWEKLRAHRENLLITHGIFTREGQQLKRVNNHREPA
jgi:glycosyltransferase involved in cell wall biosynthesis